MSEREQFTTRMMSNLDGEKDAVIERLAARCSEYAKEIAHLHAQVERQRTYLEEIANGGNVVRCDWRNAGPLTRQEMAERAIEALSSATPSTTCGEGK